MSRDAFDPARRRFLCGLGGLGAATLVGLPAAAAPAPLTRPVPATGERLPVIGMGSWITFDVRNDPAARAVRVEVLRHFFERGGAVIDSSPMYGASEEVIGHCLERLDNDERLFSATKVWTPGQWLGVQQMEHSQELWGVRRFALMQIHNMVDWDTHLRTLRDWKEQGRIRYIGITTSHGRRHDAFERIMRTQPFDFVQFTYNIRNREAEQRLLPLAAERGMGVIINRPFQRGRLLDDLQGKPLPPWAGEIDCSNWAQFLLKFIVSHPAVTCAIPATSRVDHMRENMGALYGRLPDARTRQRMVRYFEHL
ncbi:MAG: aldo/keto reductase [Candidatus Competibacterales bacterium]|nr:aldo/keto reductase [Candidatus Competibacterales bacterium]